MVIASSAHRNGGPVPSWRSNRPTAVLKHQLDHLYLSGALRAQLASAWAGAPEAYLPLGPSDNLPVMAENRGPQCISPEDGEPPKVEFLVSGRMGVGQKRAAEPD
jgi:hypothetical protein